MTSAPLTFGSSSFHRVGEIASGGMGRVDLVVRTEGTFRRLYAVKRLLDSLRDDTDVRESFIDEARIAGLIRHPNVVSVLDVGEDEEGPYLLMDYVEGVSVSHLLKHHHGLGRPLPLQVVCRIVMQAAEGLHAAHRLTEAGQELKLVHRDVSPPNLLIGFDGVVRVTDFGVAKAWGRMTQTQGTLLKGKLGYMSPEQLRFEVLDHRSDLFSLGVVLYEMATGRRLYKNRKDMDGTRRLLKEPPPDLGEDRDDAPPSLVELSFSLLAKEARHRPESARAVRVRLQSIVERMTQDEGAIEVADYLAETMATVRSERQAQVAAAIQSEVTAEVHAPEARGDQRRITAVVSACAVALVIGLAIVWWQYQVPTVIPTVQPSLNEKTTVSEVEVAAPQPPAKEDIPQAKEVAIEPASTETRQAPATKTSKRRSKRRQKKKRQQAAKPGVPMWEWE